jgi:flagellar biosynthesis/type III secretory pathway chaperone
VDDLLQALLHLLEHEAELHEQLLSCLKEEAAGFGKATGAELLQLQTSKSQLVRRIEQLEQERMDLVSDMAQRWSVPPEELRLKQIAERASGPQGPALFACHQQLTEVLEQIRQQAEHNARMAESRLKSVNTAIRFMAEAQGTQQTYSEAGKLQGSKSKFSRSSI